MGQRKETSLFTCIDRGDDRKILFLEVHIHKMNYFLELQDLIRLLRTSHSSLVEREVRVLARGVLQARIKQKALH